MNKEFLIKIATQAAVYKATYAILTKLTPLPTSTLSVMTIKAGTILIAGYVSDAVSTSVTKQLIEMEESLKELMGNIKSR